MLPILGFLLCFAGVLPAVAFSIYFWFVGQAASSAGLPGLGRLTLKLLEFLASDWKIFAVLALVLGLLVAGCVQSSRGWGFLVLGLVGAASLTQIMVASRPTEVGQVIFFLPSTLATCASLGWAWLILRSVPGN